MTGDDVSSCLTLDYYLRVREEEDSVKILAASHIVQLLEILVEGDIIVASAQLYLEARVATHVGGQPIRER